MWPSMVKYLVFWVVHECYFHVKAKVDFSCCGDKIGFPRPSYITIHSVVKSGKIFHWSHMDSLFITIQ